MNEKEKEENKQSGGVLGVCHLMGKSQSMENDETNLNDLAGASHYERAEMDESKRIFPPQAHVYEQVLGEIMDNDDENAKDNLSDYMDELKEESE